MTARTAANAEASAARKREREKEKAKWETEKAERAAELKVQWEQFRASKQEGYSRRATVAEQRVSHIREDAKDSKQALREAKVRWEADRARDIEERKAAWAEYKSRREASNARLAASAAGSNEQAVPSKELIESAKAAWETQRAAKVERIKQQWETYRKRREESLQRLEKMESMKEKTTDSGAQSELFKRAEQARMSGLREHVESQREHRRQMRERQEAMEAEARTSDQVQLAARLAALRLSESRRQAEASSLEATALAKEATKAAIEACAALDPAAARFTGLVEEAAAIAKEEAEAAAASKEEAQAKVLATKEEMGATMRATLRQQKAREAAAAREAESKAALAMRGMLDAWKVRDGDERKAQQEAWLESVRAERREEKAIIKAALEDVKGQRERAAMRASPLFVCVVCGQQKKAGSCSSCRMKPDKSDRRALATTARGAVFLSSPPTPNMLFLRDIEQPKWKNGRLAGQFS